jgi:hypothetical protein
MKETQRIIIYLSDLIGGSTAFGNEEGRNIFQKLMKELDSYPDQRIFGISLKGITRTDASFPRESVISLAKVKRGEKGFYLLDISSRDLMDNWDYAANAKDQPMIVQVNDRYEIIGPALYAGAKELLDFIMKKGVVTTSLVADKFQVSAQNASGKLKKLHMLGLILGTKEVAESGGMEFVYRAIK